MQAASVLEPAGPKRVNLHSHTSCSDGKHDAERALLEAARTDTIIGITDHNTVQAIRQLLAQAKDNRNIDRLMRRYIVPGVELQAEQGVELLIYGQTPEQLIAFYEDIIEKPDRLHETNPIFEPVDIDIVDLIQECRRWQLDVIVPHYAMRHYGIGSLPREDRKHVTYQLRQHSDHVCVERNPFVSRWHNLQAITFGKSRKNRFPVITNDDSHNGQHNSYTTIDLPELPADGYRSEQVFRAIHASPPRWKDQHLKHVPLMESIQTAASIMKQMGMRGITSTAKREILSWFIRKQPRHSLSRAPKQLS